MEMGLTGITLHSTISSPERNRFFCVIWQSIPKGAWSDAAVEVWESYTKKLKGKSCTKCTDEDRGLMLGNKSAVNHQFRGTQWFYQRDLPTDSKGRRMAECLCGGCGGPMRWR
jgi:hypothetical protein